MESPENVLKKLNTFMGKNGIFAVAISIILGFAVHMPILVSDIPNHDGLASMYYDQNMITSGRWFLMIACGISSYYALPWLIGVLSIIYLSVTSLLLVKVLRVENSLVAGLIGGFVVTFPTLTSNFAYVFTMDGYMLGLMLAVLAVYLVSVKKFGFILGAISLALSMGIYQAYLPVSMLLCLYMVLCKFAGNNTAKEKVKTAFNYAGMGALGVALYYVVLKLLLLVEGKTLDTYQGISGMDSGIEGGILSNLKQIYYDFAAFSIKGKVLFANGFALAALIILLLVFAICFIKNAIDKGLFKSVWFYILFLLTVICIPIFTNVILIVSSGVTYHVLMRYQWVIFEIIAVAYIERTLAGKQGGFTGKSENIINWITLVTAFVLIFNYAVTDNIAYSNLQKKYEKTYAYCLRLADRIEQTEGYYQGMPIYMIGVVGSDPFPTTDITADVTDHLLGIGGDYLLYTGINYEQFFKHYMGINFNFLRPEEANYYYDERYVEMPSFPANGSVKVVDGVLFVKTENSDRTEH